MRLRLLLCVALLTATAAPAAAQQASAESGGAEVAWRLLDYIAVDYREAVQGGRIVNQLEYDEMREFSASVLERLEALPDRPGKPRLIEATERLQAAIAAKAAPAEIERIARTLARDLLAAYPVALAPPSVPDLERGAALFAENCASCHGARGNADVPIAATMDPPPIDFTDRERASERSLFALYQVIDQGLEGTQMQSFRHLPTDDKWALAFRTGQFAFPPELAAEGERLWESDASLRERIPDLAALAAVTPAALAREIGADKAAAVTAFLRSNPGAVTASAGGANESLELARERLRESLAAVERGDRSEANRLALSAYLDGFEPVEAVLAMRDSALMGRVEQEMAGFRQAIGRGESVSQLRQRLAQIELLLDKADAALAPEAESSVATFLGSFAILLREGLEALLVVIAMIAFLRKAERPDALRYVHGGWVAALVAGAATWLLATYALSISGKGRELAEGFGALLAAVILLSVGVWMHGKAQADEWRRYIARKMQGALSRGSAWFLFGLAFIVVYREVFETILFYAALWTADNGAILLAGALTAVALLAAIAWAMLRLSKTLPIAQFFRYSAILIAILAVALAGKGVGALQEAGTIGITPLPAVPRIAMLGLFPTVEAVGAQLLMLVALAFGFRAAARPRTLAAPAE